MKYFFLISYYNIHITPLIDELVRQPENEVVVGLLEPAEHYRPGFGWDDSIDTNVYRRVYDDELKVTVNFLRKFDVVGLLGIYGDKDLYRAAFLSVHFTKAKVCIFSEGLKQKTFFNRLAKSLVVSLINTDRVSLFAIGSGAADDYRDMGGTNWNIFRFGYTVSRNPNSPNSIKAKVEKTVRFISIGQLIERKRVGDIFAAVGQLKSYKTKFSLDVFGDGVLREALEDRIARQGLTEIINMRGAVSYEYLFSVLPNYDCLILSSSYDGWGAVVNEAMQAGLTVILSNGVRARQLLDQPDNGIVYNTGDVSALQAGMLKFIEDSQKLRSYRENCLATIRDYFPEVLASRFSAIMKAQVAGESLPTFSSSLQKI